MKILKHGKLKDGQRVNLVGECSFCGCKFETFVDIFRNVSEEGDYVFRTDDDCKQMSIEPEWAYSGESEWCGYRISSPRVMTGVDYSTTCPECRTKVELKVKAS